MTNFKGLLPKHLTSDQASGILTKKTDEFKKMTHTSSDIASSILKVYQAYLLQLPRIMSLLFNQSIGTDQCLFYKHLRSIYLDIYKEYQNFTLDHIQSPINEITNSNSNKYISFSGQILNYQKLLKTYSLSESATIQLSKKYFKNQKYLMTSIQAYKQSFTEAKLIYNMDEKMKRYSICQQSYKQVSQDYVNVLQAKDKLEERKKEVVEAFQALLKEQKIQETEVDLKVFTFLSKFNHGICQNLRKRQILCNEGRKNVQKDKIVGFFHNFKIEDDDHNENEDGRGRRRANMSNLGMKHEQNVYQLKKIVARLQKYTQLHKNEHLKIYQFHLQFYKSAQKKSLSQLKQTLQNIEKLQKKLREQFSKQTYEQLKTASIIIKVTMDIYTQVQKKIGEKIQNVNSLIQDIKNVLKNLLQEVNNVVEKVDSKDKNKDKEKYDKEHMEASDYKEKVNAISDLIKSAQIRLSSSLCNLKIIYTQILNIYQLGIKDSYDRCEQMGNNSTKIFQQSTHNIRNQKQQKLRSTILIQLLNPQNKSKILFDADNDKNNDFKKLKKPVQIQIINKQKQIGSPQQQHNTSKQQIQENDKECQQFGNDVEEKMDGSPSKKRKKYLEFLQSKICFVQGEEFKEAFSCALADKIILQGRLYVTTQRMCFYSSFNPSNVFFGETFIQIPKKDIITLERRKNGIFFDNSISITTVKGEVFLTSFFRRNQAFNLISQIAGINRQVQAYNQDQHQQSDESSAQEHKNKSSTNKKQQQDNINEDEKQMQMQIEQAEDDIKQSQINDRAAQIQKMLDQVTFNFKDAASAEFKIPGLTAYKLLRVLVLDGEVVIAGKKFSNFIQYFKKVLQLHRDVEITPFDPPLPPHLNPTNIKQSCPIKSTRIVTSTVPTPNSNIPFVPKFTKTNEKQCLYIISKHKWVIDNQVQSSGAPYTDSFKVYYRTVCDSNAGGCKIATKVFIHFLRSVIVRGTIQSRTTQQSAMQFKKQYDELRKYLQSSYNKQKQKKQSSSSSTPQVNPSSSTSSANKQGEQQQQQQNENENENENEKQKKSKEIEIKKLKKQILIYRIVIVILLMVLFIGRSYSYSNSNIYGNSYSDNNNNNNSNSDNYSFSQSYNQGQAKVIGQQQLDL